MASDSTASDGQWTVRELRRRWKPAKERLARENTGKGLRIRIHRCCSWMQRVEETAADGLHDADLLFRWIALNSLYGCWDDVKADAASDRPTLRRFVSTIVELDRDGHIIDVLRAHRRLVLRICEDRFLDKHFWSQPAPVSDGFGNQREDAQRWYEAGRYTTLLRNLLLRVYFQRCQVVHGASTLGSRVNRDAVRRCSTILGHLLPTIVLVMIDHGEAVDWGPLCYPPRT